MIDAAQFENHRLVGGFIIVRVELDAESLTDALGREALARTRITGKRFEITIQPGLSEKELSVTLYHEILEAAAVASNDPPESIIEFNEGDFDSAAYAAHERFGPATPVNLNALLQSFGFRES
jgi:hypothetical protein